MGLTTFRVLIIDEIDFLKSSENNQETLYNIFEWTRFRQAHLAIIAISNTLDFPETLDSKIASRIGNQRLVFKQYVNRQVEQIIQQRIGGLKVFEESAVQYVCKKFGQEASDIRKSLNHLRL